ncbi:MAG: hypothetical protein ABIE43_02540, partial [Patescibacteria group bacterium]
RFLWLNISKYTLILAQKPLFVMRITLKCSIINVIYALGIRYSSTVLICKMIIRVKLESKLLITNF